MYKHRNIRAFIAVELPYSVRKPLVRFQAEIKKSNIKAAWVKPEAMHLTLKFLGDIKITDISMVKSVMEKAANLADAGFDLDISNPGIFGSPSRPKVLWIGVKDQTGSLENIASYLDTGLSEFSNIKKDGRKFFPHITLARIKKQSLKMDSVLDKQKKENLDLQFHVDGIHLFESRLYPSGAVHKNIFSVRF